MFVHLVLEEILHCERGFKQLHTVCGSLSLAETMGLPFELFCMTLPSRSWMCPILPPVLGSSGPDFFHSIQLAIHSTRLAPFWPQLTRDKTHCMPGCLCSGQMWGLFWVTCRTKGLKEKLDTWSLSSPADKMLLNQWVELTWCAA